MTWDFKIDDPIEFFDRTLSYELTGSRPIDEHNGLDFNIEWFTEASRRYKRIRKYCEYSQGSKRYVDFWKEEIRRFREGYEVNGYRLTGDNYFFINYYRLIDPIALEENFPTFTNVHYEWFHYVDMCEKLQKDCIALKARGVNKPAPR